MCLPAITGAPTIRGSQKVLQGTVGEDIRGSEGVALVFDVLGPGLSSRGLTYVGRDLLLTAMLSSQTG